MISRCPVTHEVCDQPKNCPDLCTKSPFPGWPVESIADTASTERDERKLFESWWQSTNLGERNDAWKGWRARSKLASPTQVIADTAVAKTYSGFCAAFFASNRRNATEQEIFDAGVRAGIARVSPAIDTAGAKPWIKHIDAEGNPYWLQHAPPAPSVADAAGASEDARDAARYRWLVKNCFDWAAPGDGDSFDHIELHFESDMLSRDDESVGRAIDAEIAKESGND